MKFELAECFGVPGVGKTYIVETSFDMPGQVKIWSGKSSRYLRAIGKGVALLTTPIFHFAHFLWAYRLSGFFFKKISVRRLKIIVNLIYLQSCIREIRLHPTNNKVLFDQGICQIIWSCAFSTKLIVDETALTSHILHGLRMLGVSTWSILHVAAPPNVIISRLNRRQGDSPIDKCPSLINRALAAEAFVIRVLKAGREKNRNNLRMRIRKIEN